MRRGRPRSPATLPGFHADRSPRNKGMRYPGDPPQVEEIVVIMREAGETIYGDRLRGLIVVLWRAGLRIQEALELFERDLDERRRALLVRHGKGDKRREVGMDDWGWEQLRAWLAERTSMPVGPLFCMIDGHSRATVERQRGPRPASAGRRPRRGAASLCPSPACVTRTRSSWLRKEMPLNIIQRQLGHTDLGVTSIYLLGIDNHEIINPVHGRRTPMMSASAGLRR